MRSKFSWYFTPSIEEIEKAWKYGVLSVDTNVLLDLYRYHKETRDSLLKSIREFEGSKWLSFQAGSEFFRNRKKVIISSEKSFKTADEEISKFSKNMEQAVNHLKGIRIIPAEVSKELEKVVSSAVSKATEEINIAKNDYPQFLQKDSILEELAEIFDGAIGDDFPEDQKPSIRDIAEERKKNMIPPGYADDEKEGDRPYGDYYLWRQVLEHAAEKKKPIILVTSERKEDWWERISGKTTGPRPELLQEALTVSGQRIHIYQTEQFLEHALQRAKQPINETAIEEIRAINLWRDEIDKALKEMHTLTKWHFETELESAVVIKNQTAIEESSTINSGTLHIELRRPVKNFTASGRLQPRMINVPQIKATLISAPEELKEFSLSMGAGKVYDFNIHIHSRREGVHLPIGNYIFEYEAKCNPLE